MDLKHFRGTGYFAPNFSRYGQNPAQFKHLLTLPGWHSHLDWVQEAFCKDAHGSKEFDGISSLKKKSILTGELLV